MADSQSPAQLVVAALEKREINAQIFEKYVGQFVYLLDNAFKDAGFHVKNKVEEESSGQFRGKVTAYPASDSYKAYQTSHSFNYTLKINYALVEDSNEISVHVTSFTKDERIPIPRNWIYNININKDVKDQVKSFIDWMFSEYRQDIENGQML
jgi:hypothetical protein